MAAPREPSAGLRVSRSKVEFVQTVRPMLSGVVVGHHRGAYRDGDSVVVPSTAQPVDRGRARYVAGVEQQEDRRGRRRGACLQPVVILEVGSCVLAPNSAAMARLRVGPADRSTMCGRWSSSSNDRGLRGSGESVDGRRGRRHRSDSGPLADIGVAGGVDVRSCHRAHIRMPEPMNPVISTTIASATSHTGGWLGNVRRASPGTQRSTPDRGT